MSNEHVTEIKLQAVPCLTIMAPREVSTHQLLTIAHRLLAETPELQSVVITRPATTSNGKSVLVTLRRESGWKISESWEVS